MKTIEVKEFEAICLKAMDRVRATRDSVLITKKGRPAVKLIPADPIAGDIFGCLAGTIEIVGDIESLVEPPEA